MAKKVKEPAKSVVTFIHPSGFVEQHYIGDQTGKTVDGGVRAADRAVKKQIQEKKTPLVLIDISEVTSTDLGSHASAVKGMKRVPYKRIAIYGPLSLQILLNTLAKVADKYDSVHAFSNRVEAIEWLNKK